MRLATVLTFALGVAAGVVINALAANAPTRAGEDGSSKTAQGATHSGSAAVPAFLVVAGETLDPNGLGPYRELAGPVARAAGLKMVARGDADKLQLLEGEWHYPGFVAVEQFSSMDDLLGFWNSEQYQAARKLREGKVNLHFVLALEGAAQ